MRQSLRLGRIAGIPVGVHWTVGVILLLIADVLGVSVLPAAREGLPTVVYWTVAVLGAAVFAGSLLVHELSHAIVAKRHGVRVRSITLWMLGGVAELDGDPPDPAADLRIALAGPASSLALGVLLAGLALGIDFVGGPMIVVVALGWLALMNGVLAVFNMLPGAPMDGGRVLRAVLWRRHGDRVRAAITATRAGRVVGFALIAAGLAELLGWASLGGLWLILIGWFLIAAAGAEARATIAGTALAGLRVAEIMTPSPVSAPSWTVVQDFIDTVAARSRQPVYPVVEFDGRLAGIVIAEPLARLRPAERASLRVGQVALPVPPEYLAGPDDPAATVSGRPPLGGVVAAVVLEHGRVVGLVTTAGLDWALRRATMAARPAAAGPARYGAPGGEVESGHGAGTGHR
jgi:Zn-dependent protease